MKLAFGIDLGTTYSCISYVDEFGKPVVLKNSDGAHTTPSVVYVESSQNIIVGEEAKRTVEVKPDDTVQFIKRKMGKSDNVVILNNTKYTAQEISGYILKKLVEDANSELRQSGVLKDGEAVKDVVITCPAYFGMNEKNATMEAGKLAGLNVLDIINEPTAAAISYGVTGSSKKETVLVYDLGGGTFDITVMHINGGNIQVVCTGGDDHLGGKDWDDALIGYVTEKFEAETGEDLYDDEEAVAALYLDVENWKKALTSREKVNISVRAQGQRLREELTRAQYEDITRNLLNRTKDLLDNILQTAASQGYPLNSIDKVLLVGGSSRMPQVAKMIQEEYGITPVLQDPDEAVAKGAAIYAQDRSAFQDFVQQEVRNTGKTAEEIMLSGRNPSGGLQITNVLPCSYGIECLNEANQRIISNLLKMNAPLPATMTKTFYTHADGQTGADICLYETRTAEDSLQIENNIPLTTVKLTFHKPVPMGTAVVVTLTLDNSGILHIHAVENYTNAKVDAPFALSHQMDSRDLEAAANRVNAASVE